MKTIKDYGVRIMICALFFLTGFLLVGNLLGISVQQMALGLTAGAVGGIVVLLMMTYGKKDLSTDVRRRFDSI